MRLRPAVCEFYASVCNRVLVSIGKQASKGALKTVDEEKKMLDKSNFFVDTAKTKTFPTSKKNERPKEIFNQGERRLFGGSSYIVGEVCQHTPDRLGEIYGSVKSNSFRDFGGVVQRRIPLLR